jgi:D-glycero-D-manno-heptose 1,7-bisphosphate phosphatase
MNKAIFLDRDGTINEDTGYTHKVEDLEFVNSAVQGLQRMQQLGYKLIIVTNQAGIAKGKFEEEDYFHFSNELRLRLQENGVIINAEYFCPHHSEGTIEKYKIDCNCRKPKPGMLEQAAKDFNLDLGKCWMIGDTPSDILAGKNAGCKTIQVLTGKDKTESKDANFLAYDLFHASYFIS